MGEHELTAADLAEITYPAVVTVEHGRQYQATIGRHVVTLERIPTIPGAWKASVAGLGLVGGNRYELAGPRFYWSDAWAYAFPSAKEALFAAVALLAVVKEAPDNIAEDIPGADFPVAVLTIDPSELAAFAGVPYPLPAPNDVPAQGSQAQLFHLIDRITAHRPDLIRAIDKASGGLDDLQVFGADGAEEFLGIAVDDGGVPTGRRSRHILISPSLLHNSAATRARLASVLPMIMTAPLRVVINTDF